MILPERIAEFIHGPVYMCAGSRDEKLKPCVVHVVGALVSPDRASLTFFVPEWASGRFVENLRSNGKLSFNSAHGGEGCYQIKGNSTEIRPCEPRDYAIQDIYIKKFSALLVQMGLSQDFAPGWVTKPSLAVKMNFEKIFDQTPGPRSGTEIKE